MNQANQNDWPKETQKKYPIKVIQTAMRAQPSNSGTLLLSLPVCLSRCTVCTLFPPNKYLTCFTKKKTKHIPINNLEKMDKFLERYNVPKLKQEKIEKPNRPSTSMEIKNVIKKSFSKQKPRTRYLNR